MPEYAIVTENTTGKKMRGSIQPDSDVFIAEGNDRGIVLQKGQYVIFKKERKAA